MKATTTSLTKVETLAETIHRLAVKYKVNESLLNEIIRCESGHKKEALNRNGTWSVDHGLMQINDYYHKESMQVMGWSIYKWEDSLEYGVKLLANEGTRHWKASAHCWNN